MRIYQDTSVIGGAFATSFGAETKPFFDKNITERVVGKTNLIDCRHIAIATVHRADVLAMEL